MLSRVIARGAFSIGLNAGSRKRVGVGGGGSCDTAWVPALLAQARAAAACDQAGPDSLVFPASNAMAVGDSETIEVTVQRNGFVGRRLVIPDSIAAGLQVDDVRVGGRSIMTSQNPISGEAFSTKADVCTFLKFPTSGAGIDYSLDLSNANPTSIAWVTATAYGLGVLRTSNNNLYRVIRAGTSGASAPSGMGTNISDGSANGLLWEYVAPYVVTARGVYIEGASW